MCQILVKQYFEADFVLGKLGLYTRRLLSLEGLITEQALGWPLGICIWGGARYAPICLPPATFVLLSALPRVPHTPLGLLLEDSSQPVSGLAEGPLSSSSCAFPLGDTTFVSFLCNKSQRPEQTCWVLGVFLIIHWMGVCLRPWTPMRYLTQFINLSMRGRLHYLPFVRKLKNKRLSDLNKDIHTLIELGFQHLLLPVSWERETGATYWSIILIFLGITSSFQVKRIEYRRVQVYASKEQ